MGTAANFFAAVTALLLILAAVPRPAGAQAAQSAPALQITPEERQFFALGVTLARGAFAYAELANGAAAAAKGRSRIAQVGPLGKLAPMAGRNRASAQESMAQALVLMRALHAPPTALAPVQSAANRLTGELKFSSDARTLALFNRNAARTVASLNEFETLSSLPENPALQTWMAGPALPDAASVWYGEGEMAGLTQIAALHKMPNLLPPAAQVTGDVRGLRDWLVGRFSDPPTPEQAALETALNRFLKTSSAPGSAASPRPLTLPQLEVLGDISRRVRAQVLSGTLKEAQTAL